MDPTKQGGRILIAAPGPSLEEEDLEEARDEVCVLTVNDAWRWAPWCAGVYAADHQWWTDQVARFPELLTIDAERFMAARDWNGDEQRVLRELGLTGVRYHANTGELIRGDLVSGMPPSLAHSGHQAIQLAWGLGFTDIALTGFDCGMPSEEQPHCFGKHPKRKNPTPEKATSWATHYQMLDHLPVVNCSRVTSISAFPRCGISDWLSSPARSDQVRASPQR